MVRNLERKSAYNEYLMRVARDDVRRYFYNPSFSLSLFLLRCETRYMKKEIN